MALGSVNKYQFLPTTANLQQSLRVGIPLRRFILTQIKTGFILTFMDKQQIKQRLLQAIKNDPYTNDIKSVALFGSYVNGQPKEDSDVDVLIEFMPDAHIGFFKLVDIKQHLEEFVGKEVNIVTPEALSKYFRDEVLAQAESIYEKR
jgi:predicted nucleotidyltransferase